MEIPLLQDIVIILGLAVLIILLFQKIKVPSILGFLVTGLIAGPYGLSLIQARHEVELLSEIGIIFLLFVIGIEFSLKGLSSIKKTILIGGFFQVGGTILITALVCNFMGLSWKESVFIGFLFSLSSTAIVLNILQSRGEITAPHGRIAVAILIFQDIIVVPMILITPIIAGQSDNAVESILILVGKVVGIIGVIILLARYLVPYILQQVVRTRRQELFILATIVLCFATAWLTSAVGLSLALGAFFAGLIISESDYSHQATANILPFREIFISFFFVSIGMLLNINFLLQHIYEILLFTVIVIVAKSTVVGIAVILLRYPVRTVLLTAFSLFQVGEFAFILSKTGIEYSLLSENIYQYFLSISILSMASTPFLFNIAPRVTNRFMRSPLSKKVSDKLTLNNNDDEEEEKIDLHDHLVIIGYGINGKNVARAAKNANIPYIIIELNPDTVTEMKEKGEPIMFGDATQDFILHHVHIHEARVVVIAISDPVATRKIVSQVRMHTKTAYLIVRTRYVKEIEETLRLGADEVIPEEFETSIEIFSKVLSKYLIPADQIQNFVYMIRSQNYDMLRNPGSLTSKPANLSLDIPEVSITVLPVTQGFNKVVGKTIKDSGLRESFGINILAIKRGEAFITHIKPDDKILQDDVLYVFGNQQAVTDLNKFLSI